MKKIKRALISVSDKKNLKDLLKVLTKYKIELISSGGTYNEIRKLKFKCLEVSEYTGFSEILGGRVKTLHPKIHAGILSKRNKKSHIKDLEKNNFSEIDLVIVNFYPFEKTLEQTNNHLKIIENIDVGGPTMVRAAAKNYKSVAVLTDPSEYANFSKQLKDQKETIQNLENAILNQEQQKEILQKIQQELQNKKDLNWNDKKKVDEFIRMQKQHQKMMERQTEKLQQSLEQNKGDKQTLQDKKQQLQDRIKELLALNKQKKLFFRVFFSSLDLC